MIAKSVRDEAFDIVCCGARERDRAANEVEVGDLATSQIKHRAIVHDNGVMRPILVVVRSAAVEVHTLEPATTPHRTPAERSVSPHVSEHRQHSSILSPPIRAVKDSPRSRERGQVLFI